MKKEKINCEKAKKMDALIVAKNLGLIKAKESNNQVWFFYKNERTASLKIDARKNEWYNHSLGQGGNPLDLIIHILKCSVSEALEFLNKDSHSNPFSSHQQPKKKSNQVKNYKILKVKKLEHQALIDYLISRKLDITITKKYCQEIHYELDLKKYFTIAFENDKKGFEIRNKYFKGNLLNKNISTINNGSKSLCVFEGFIDFLSFKTYFKNKSFSMDYIILNSTSNINKVIEKINNYEKVFCYLDHDTTGINGTEALIKNHKNCIDYSFIYKGYNDFNEFLMRRPDMP